MMPDNRSSLPFLEGGVVFLCFLLSCYVFYPGWMSADSFSHYRDAIDSSYRDWVPVLYSWIWNKFLYIHDGPSSMMLLNLVTYWSAFFLVSYSAKIQGLRFSFLIPFFGFWPGIFFELGFLWKDVLFSTSIFLCWAVVIHFNIVRNNSKYIHLFFIFVLSVVAFGVKSNGILVIPILIYFYFSTASKYFSIFKRVIYSIVFSVAVIVTPKILTFGSHIEKQQDFMVQYTQVYDILGISVKNNKNLFPNYIKDIYGDDLEPYKKLYWPGGNNHLFFGLADYGGPVATKDPGKAKQLTTAWIDSIFDYPVEYALHRYENMSAMLRIGAYTPAWVGDVGILDNDFGLAFNSNSISDFLEKSKSDYGWFYLPWAYFSLLFSLFIFCFFRRNIDIVFPIFLSVVVFAGPHFFILPAADYRYLYYCYLMAVAMIPISFMRKK